ATTFNAPYWVRLTRVGNTFTAFRSADGVTWVNQGSTNITMNTTVEVGLGVSSHSAGVLCTAQFSNVQLIQPNPPIATIDAPATGTLFRAGDTINFRGHATQGGSPLPASAFTW